MRILVTDEVDPEGVELLRAESRFDVDVRPTAPWASLLDSIGEYDAFVGRSATQLPAELLRRATRLQVIGRAGVGTDNIDVEAATALGIAVINAPAGNTVSVAELFFGQIIGLFRHLPQAVQSMREGRWDRNKLLGGEVRGHKLGIVGLGRIGGAIAARARTFDVTVLAYDPYISAERFEYLQVTRCESLDDVLRQSDIVTIHTPLTDETRGLIGERELGLLHDGAVIANMARGGIIREGDLLEALDAGRLRGAILDVFEKEPLAADHPLRRHPRVILTPHLGASTAEGQRNVAVDVCAGVRDALLKGQLGGAINIAGGENVRWNELRGALELSRRMAMLGRALLADRGARAVTEVSLRLGRELAYADDVLLSSAATGILEGVVEGARLNVINARTQAEARGIALAVAASVDAVQPHQIQLSVRSDGRDIALAGLAPPGATPRLTRIGAFGVDVSPRRTMVVLTNADVPGVIGRVGTLLGDSGVNIAEYHQARMTQGGEAMAAITVDGPVAGNLRRRLLALSDVKTATVVNFGDAEG